MYQVCNFIEICVGDGLWTSRCKQSENCQKRDVREAVPYAEKDIVAISVKLRNRYNPQAAAPPAP